MNQLCFHLAENTADSNHPFVFLATLEIPPDRPDGNPRYIPLEKALEIYLRRGDRDLMAQIFKDLEGLGKISGFLREHLEHNRSWGVRLLKSDEAYGFLTDSHKLLEHGAKLSVPSWWQSKSSQSALSVKLELNSKEGERPISHVGFGALFAFSIRGSLGGVPLSDEEWAALEATTSPLVYLRGMWVDLKSQRVKDLLSQWRAIEGLRENQEGMSFAQAMRIVTRGTLGGMGFSNQDPVRAESVSSFLDFKALEPAPWSESSLGLRATLREYQKQGVCWLMQMRELGVSPLLADDMGLGKTIQIITWLLWEYGERKEQKPTLLLVPASLLPNWVDEFAKFAPDLKISVHHPSFLTPYPDDPPIIISTLGMLQRSPKLLDSVWSAVVVDEAQSLKNPDAKQTLAVKSLKSNFRIAMTGTPIENHLGDLCSIFGFLNPGVLPEDTRPSPEVLRVALDPYVLRRLKTDRKIIRDLPEKIERVSYCQLSKAQVVVYKSTLEGLSAELKQKDLPQMQKSALVLKYLIRFKQICNHPSQYFHDGLYAPEDSGKFARLYDLGAMILEHDARGLIFTQFREMTGPLQKFLGDQFGEEALVLHGGLSVQARRDLVARFQGGEARFFILSLKAGGSGLNLTQASHVIHFDRWWNPAVENQATDRAFRIGQIRNVEVHKMVCRGTIEEKIHRMILGKSELAESVLSGNGMVKQLVGLSRDELVSLFAFSER